MSLFLRSKPKKSVPKKSKILRLPTKHPNHLPSESYFEDNLQSNFIPVEFKTTVIKTQKLSAAIEQLLKRHDQDTTKLIDDATTKIESQKTKIKKLEKTLDAKLKEIKRHEDKPKVHKRKMDDLKKKHQNDIKIQVNRVKEKLKAAQLAKKKVEADYRLKSKEMTAKHRQEIMTLKKQFSVKEQQLKKEIANLNKPKMPSRSGRSKISKPIRPKAKKDLELQKSLNTEKVISDRYFAENVDLRRQNETLKSQLSEMDSMYDDFLNLSCNLDSGIAN